MLNTALETQLLFMLGGSFLPLLLFKYPAFEIFPSLRLFRCDIWWQTPPLLSFLVQAFLAELTHGAASAREHTRWSVKVTFVQPTGGYAYVSNVLGRAPQWSVVCRKSVDCKESRVCVNVLLCVSACVVFTREVAAQADLRQSIGEKCQITKITRT